MAFRIAFCFRLSCEFLWSIGRLLKWRHIRTIQYNPEIKYLNQLRTCSTEKRISWNSWTSLIVILSGSILARRQVQRTKLLIIVSWQLRSAKIRVGMAHCSSSRMKYSAPWPINTKQQKIGIGGRKERTSIIILPTILLMELHASTIVWTTPDSSIRCLVRSML